MDLRAQCIVHVTNKYNVVKKNIVGEKIDDNRSG
jgi:hypothetical protein